MREDARNSTAGDARVGPCDRPHDRALSDRDGAAIPIALVLQRISEELGELAFLSGEVQQIAGAVASRSRLESEDTRRVQSLDLVTQVLGSLAGAVGEIAAASPDGTVDRHALERHVVLHDLRDRLLDAVSEARRDPPAGTVALF